MERLVLDSILHPTDFSDSDAGAAAHALRIALAARAKLTLLHVGAKGQDIDWAGFPRIRRMLAAWGVVPADADHEAVLATGLQVRKSLRKGEDVVAEIVGEAKSTEADLVVLATHQRQGMARWLNRPLAETIAREARQATLFVPRQVEGFVRRDTGKVHLSRVLVPVSAEPSPGAAVRAAIGLARGLKANPVTFVLLHLGTEETFPRFALPEVKDEGFVFQRQIQPGGVVDGILDEAEEQEVDLIVMATDGREGFLDALRGTSTEQVLRGAKCPLLAVPA